MSVPLAKLINVDGASQVGAVRNPQGLSSWSGVKKWVWFHENRLCLVSAACNDTLLLLLCCKLFLGEVNDGGVPWKGKLSIVPLGKMLNHWGFFIWGVSYMLLVWLCLFFFNQFTSSCQNWLCFFKGRGEFWDTDILMNSFEWMFFPTCSKKRSQRYWESCNQITWRILEITLTFECVVHF